ncbi:MAG: peptide ABC transporter substrate-binding protein, partial [Verrucomicrobiota bacterium]
ISQRMKSRNLRSRLAAALGLAAALMVSSGCGDRERRVDKASREKILLLANGTEPKSIDPHIVSGVPEHHLLMALFEGLLVEHPSDDEKLDPGVATHWEPLDAAKRWMFYLRKDARWSNGDPVTAHDFVYGLRRVLSPKLASEYADFAYIVDNAENYHKGEITDFSEVGVKAINDYQLEFTLVGPSPYFPKKLHHYVFYPVHQETIERFGKIDDRISKWPREGNFVGNGPFALKSWRFKQIIETIKNPYYWDAKNVKLNGINFYPIDDQTTEERAFRDGQLHKIYDLTLDKIVPYKENDPDKLRLDTNNAVYFYRINTTRKPFGDVRVRKALSMTIDREAIVTDIRRGAGKVAYGLVPPTEGGLYKTPDVIRYDPDKARQLLSEAGFPNGKGFPKFTILINTHEAHRIIAEAIQEMWKKELNIDVNINNQDWQVYLNSQHSLDYDVARAGWNADFQDPVTFLDMWKEGNGNNDTGFANPTYDGLLDAAGQEGDPAKRFEILQEAEALFLEELPAIPIYWYVRAYVIHPDVVGWHPKLSDNHPYKHVDVVPGGSE